MQLADGDRLVALDHRRTRRIAVHTEPDQLVQRMVGCTVPGRSLRPHARDQVTFGVGEQVDVEHTGRGVGDDAGEQHFQAIGQRPDPEHVEQVGAICQGRHIAAVVVSEDVQSEIVMGDLGGGPDLAEPERTGSIHDGFHGGGQLIDCQADLEERRIVGDPRQGERLDDVDERHVLGGERLQRGLAAAGEQFPETRVACQPGTHGHHVHEVADHVLDPSGVAVRHGGADHEVSLGAVLGQQHLVQREHGHVEGGPFGGRQRLELFDEPRRERELVSTTPAGQDRRARPGDVEFQVPGTGEPLHLLRQSPFASGDTLRRGLVHRNVLVLQGTRTQIDAAVAHGLFECLPQV